MRHPFSLRSLLPALVALAWAAGSALAASPAPSTPSMTAFRGFLADFRPEAERQGIGLPLFDRTFADVSPDPSLAPLLRSQPEFAKPIGAYLAAQATAGRIATGRDLMQRWRADLTAIEARYGVPPSIVVAVWGLETNYGTSPGSKDVIRSLATLAAMDYRPALYRAELIAALRLLQDDAVPRDRLRGSWAGAMGQPQFMPSSFARYAVDGDGDGRRDIWGSVPDALASIANFIKQQGWSPDQPWGFEVRRPAGLDPGQSRDTFDAWTARGVVRADGRALPAKGEGILFFPAGASGPAFLVTANYEVLKTYNFSDAYVLSVAQLADRMEGGAPIAGTWPLQPSMARDHRIALQSRLAALGYAVDNREGRISLALRDIIRKAQARAGLVPDGNPTDALLARLGGSPTDQRQ